MYEHENKRDIHARSSSAARLATSRRAAGCGNEPSRCLNFCHALWVYERPLGSWNLFAVVDIEYERFTLRLLPVHFVSRVPFSFRRSLSPPSLAPIKGRSLLSERRTRTSPFSRHRFQSLRCCCLPHPGLRRAAGQDSRPPKPHLFESCMGEE